MDFRNRSTKVIRSTWSVLSNILTKMQRGGGQLTERGNIGMRSIKIMTKILTKI
jgi:hypothetical protein